MTEISKIGRGDYIAAPTLAHKAKSLQWQSNSLINNPGVAGAAGAVTGAGISQTPQFKKHRSVKQQKRDKVVAAGLVGGAAGYGANHAAFYGLKNHYRGQEKKGALKPYRKKMDRAKSVARKVANGNERKLQEHYQRNFPSDVPTARARHLSAAMGRKTKAGLILGGAAIGAETVAHKKKVSKSLKRRAEGAAQGAALGVGGSVAVTGARTLPKAKWIASQADVRQRRLWAAAHPKKRFSKQPKMPLEQAQKLNRSRRAFSREATIQAALVKSPKKIPLAVGAVAGGLLLRKEKVAKVSPHNAGYHWTQHFAASNLPHLVRSNPQLDAFGLATAGAVGAQAPVLDKHRSKKARKRADIATAGVLGAAGGQAAYQGAGYGAKKANQKVNDPKIYHDPKRRKGYKSGHYKKINEAAKKAHGLKNPNGAKDFLGYARNMPKELPGSGVTRTLAHTHGGRTGFVTGAAATAAGAVGGIHVRNKRHEKVHKRSMSQAEINRRKKVQGLSSQVGGTLGLAALGGTLLATKRGSSATKAAFKSVGRERPTFLKPKRINAKIAPVLATSAGIGGASAFNFAAYTKAEAKQRKKKVPVMKYDPYEIEFPLASEVGIAKRYYDPEEKRMKRADNLQAGANVAGGAAAVGAVHQGSKAAKKIKLVAINQHPNAGKEFRVPLKGAGHAGKAAGLAAGAAGAVYAGKKIRDKTRNGNSWDIYR